VLFVKIIREFKKLRTITERMRHTCLLCTQFLTLDIILPSVHFSKFLYPSKIPHAFLISVPVMHPFFTRPHL